MEVHVVSKTNNTVHAVATINDPAYESHDLAASSVRVRPLLVSLTSNNLSYARGGDFLHWWDTYPVPAELPSPYNDQTAWGIVPAWGYGAVTESTTDITPGTLLYGFWPTANIPVSLKLQRSEPKGQWTEVGESRKRLMTIYSVYSEEGRIELPPGLQNKNNETGFFSSLVDEDTLKRLGWISLFRPTWQTGYLLSRYTFTSSPESRPPVHPLGMNLPWTAADADISAAAVISLSASSKTARSFAYHVFRRRAVEGPLGLLQVSQTPELLELVPGKLGAEVPAKAVRYDQVDESVRWIAEFKPARIVLLDFGARAGTLAQLVESIKNHPDLETLQLTIFQVGSEQKVYSPEEIKETRTAMQTMGKIQVNTSTLRDSVVNHTSAEDYYTTHVQPEWEVWMRVSHEITPDIQVTLGAGVSGTEGLEGGWSRLCQGSVGTQEGLVYTM